MLKDQNNHAGFICQKALLERGWTKAMIEEINLKPEVYTDNPHNSNWSFQKLYSKYAVIAWEKTDWFHDRMVAAAKRRRARLSKKSIGQSKNA